MVQEGDFVDKKEVKDLSIYAKKFDEDIASFREFEAMDYVKSLKNQDQLDEAIEVGKTFLEARPDLKAYINHYGYALYNKYVKNEINKESINEDTFFEIVNEILSVCKQERFSPYEATCNAVIKYASKKDPVDYETIHTYLEKMDPTLLSKEPFTAEGKKEGESKYERWYRLNVRSCYEMGDYKRCIEVANQAMTLNIKWHYRNAYWIRYYRAKAHLQLGQYGECEKEYLALQTQFFDVDFYKDLYQIYAGLGEHQKANAYLLYDVYISGYDKKQVPLYRLLLESSKQAGQEKIASLLEAMLAQFKNEAGQTVEVEETYKDKDSGKLYDLMIDELTRHLDAYVERKHGKVIHYNEEKQLGTIVVSNEPSVFFRQADFIYDEEVRRYERVDFTEINTYDAKKQSVTTKACLILEGEDDDLRFNY